MRRRIIWTALMDEYLMKKRAQGEPFYPIASALNVTRASAACRYIRLCNQLGISPYKRKLKKHAPETLDTVIVLRRSGKSHKQIARELNLGINQVCGIWNHWRDHRRFRSAEA